MIMLFNQGLKNCDIQGKYLSECNSVFLGIWSGRTLSVALFSPDGGK